MWTSRPAAAPALASRASSRASSTLARSIGYSVIVALIVACGSERSVSQDPELEPTATEIPASVHADAPAERSAASPAERAIPETTSATGPGPHAQHDAGALMRKAPTGAEQRSVREVRAADELAAESAGLLGALGEATGSPGLGARGTGLGGGGTASGLGRDPAMKDSRANASGAKARIIQGTPTTVVTAPLQTAASTEGYTSYGVNNMTLAENDHLSTFSIDVDTASFSITRRKLTEGSLPPSASVRVEEFVNYFPYKYAQPTGGAPFSVNLEAAPNPWEPNHQLVRVGVQGRSVAEGKERPRRLTFLVDTSGSMQSQDKMGLVKESLRYLVHQLGPEDSVAIVTYAGWTSVVLEATPVTRKQDILDAIEELSAGGSTAMGSGLDLAYKQASRAYVKGAENRVLLLSDGDANVGPTSHEELLKIIQRHAGEGITLSTLGFGMGNYQDTIMEQLADKGDGNYFYVDSLAEGRRVFGEKLSGTMDTIARDVKIQVDWNKDAVLSYRLVGYENRDIADKDFRNDKVDAGEVGSGHSVTALYDVILRDGALDSNKTIATVQIRAKEPGPDRPAKEWSTPLTSSAFRSEVASTSADFRVALAAASFAEILRGSRYSNELSYADVYKLAQGARRKGVSEDGELLDLIARAGALSGQRGPWSKASVAER